MEKQNQFIASVTELFMRYGIKSLTMDDISRHLGISKKTLYQYASDKKDLVKKGMELMIKEDQQYISDVVAESTTAIDELIGVTKCISSKLSDIHPSVIFDLQKYHPEAWKVMEDHKGTFIYEMMLKNLRRGIKEGYYRDNIDPLVIANIYIGMMDNILNPESPINKKISIDKLHTEVIRYHIKGIANNKGIVYLKKALDKEENNNLLLD